MSARGGQVERLEADTGRPDGDDAQGPVSDVDGEKVFQGHPQEAAEQHTDHAGVGYHEGPALGKLEQPFEEGPNPAIEIAEGFPARRAVIGDAAATLLKRLGIAALNGGKGLAVPFPERNFPQFRA